MYTSVIVSKNISESVELIEVEMNTISIIALFFVRSYFMLDTITKVNEQVIKIFGNNLFVLRRNNDRASCKVNRSVLNTNYVFASDTYIRVPPSVSGRSTSSRLTSTV